MSNSSPPSKTSQRFGFVDLLRGWAVLVMIETHVVNALLTPDLKKEPLYAIVTFFNGLVAPSFLFCAGFSFAIASHRKWSEFISLKKTYWRYIFRLLFILVVGYSLHVPIFSLHQLLGLHDAQRWLPFYQSDILQVISLTLLFLALSGVVVRSERLLIRAAAVIALCIVFTAPIVRGLDYSTTAVWLRPYFSPAYKSQFPLFPWSAFLIGGTVLGVVYLRIRETGKESTGMPRLALLALGGIILSLLIEVIPVTIYPGHNFWQASPEFFFVRFGLVLLAFVYAWWFEQRLSIAPRSPLVLFGQESLLVYVVHLLIVYGHTYKWSLIRTFGPTLNYLQCAGLFLALTVGMVALAYIWHRLKAWNRQVSGIIQYVVLGAIVLEFLVAS